MQRLAALVIDANHLLVPRDDPRFHRGDSFRIGDDAFVRNARGAKAFLQRPPGLVISDDPERFHVRPECSDVCGNVARPAQAFALLNEIHHGNGRFRREPRGRAPEVAVQHQVAEHADALATQSRDQSFQPGNGIGNAGGHAGSWIFLLLDRLFFGDFRFFRQHDGNFIAHRIDAPARTALQARAVA